jgi:SEC-C motif
MTKPGRNDPCPCGSGQKYKRCCLPKDQAAESAALKAVVAAKAAEGSPHEHVHGPDCAHEHS